MKNLLYSLITFSKPIQEIKTELKSIDWDSDEEVLLDRKMVIDVINRFILGDIEPEDLDEWANAIECREDIEYEEVCFDDIKQVIFEIANQSMEGIFDSEKAKAWIDRLDS